ncbi:MAG: RHS repeat-associated core domain-containing protein [Clostridium sp.]|jgi:RHS repeat-associated protein|nr:RHS repeat-associated core domain-containing protein [Clostridium sp.]
MKNAQNDVTGIVDSDLNVVVEYSYDAWGRLIDTTGSEANFIGKLNPFLYRGYYYDAETGLYYLGGRYYDPVTGRFLNADGVIGAEGSLFGSNLFTYCKNNPVVLSDPNGYWPTWGQIGMAALTVAIAAVAVVAVVASAGMVGITLGVAAASIGASGATISAAITIGTVGTYAVAAGTGAFALSDAGEILTGKNLIRDKVMGGNQKAYDAVQAGLTVAGAGAIAVRATKPGISGKAATPSANASKVHKVPTQGTPVS